MTESESLRSLKSVFAVAGCGQVIHVIRMDECALFDWFLLEELFCNSFKFAVTQSN